MELKCICGCYSFRAFVVNGVIQLCCNECGTAYDCYSVIHVPIGLEGIVRRT